MPNYRRAFVPGGTWFFTATLLDRRSRLLIERIDELRAATRWTMERRPFHIDAFVVLPDHIPCRVDLAAWRHRLSAALAPDQQQFSRAMPRGEPRSPVRRARGERGIWERRFWEHLIRDDADFQRHVEYCYINPLKHGLVRRVQDWPHSSFHRDVARGLVPLDWAGEVVIEGDFGERR